MNMTGCTWIMTKTTVPSPGHPHAHVLTENPQEPEKVKGILYLMQSKMTLIEVLAQQAKAISVALCGHGCQFNSAMASILNKDWF